MKPSKQIQKDFQWPFPFRPYQEETIDDLWEFTRAGYYICVGGGKTAVATAAALVQAARGKCDQIIVVCPPILINQWYDWLEELSALNGGMFDTLIYRGTPTQRREMDLAKHDFLIMSIQILKNDFKRLYPHAGGTKLSIILDEAQSIRNVSTKSYKAIRDFSIGNNLLMLTGTPVNNPIHCYSYIKLIAPTLYRSMRMFKNIHVSKEDFFGQAIEFQNLDLLRENLLLQSKMFDSADVIDNLPDVIHVPVRYDLSAKHQKLYKKLVREELLVLEDEVVDATTAMRMYHQLQQLVLNPGKFSDQDIPRPAGMDVLDETLEELQLDGPLSKDKLIVFNNYRSSNEMVYEYLDKKYPGQVRICYGGTGPTKSQRFLKEFLTDPEVKYLVASPRSIGVGLNLQSACRYLLFMELPLTSNDFNQAYQRVARSGQTHACTIKMSIASSTIQEHLMRAVLEKEGIVQQLAPTQQNLITALKSLT